MKRPVYFGKKTKIFLILKKIGNILTAVM